jgi:hypothetical protein
MVLSIIRDNTNRLKVESRGQYFRQSQLILQAVRQGRQEPFEVGGNGGRYGYDKGPYRG